MQITRSPGGASRTWHLALALFPMGRMIFGLLQDCPIEILKTPNNYLIVDRQLESQPVSTIYCLFVSSFWAEVGIAQAW